MRSDGDICPCLTIFGGISAFRRRFIAVNRPFGLACGVDPHDLAGKTDLDIWPPELAERYREGDRKVMESGLIKRVEEPLRDKRGRQIWIETIKVPVKDDRGRVIGTVGIAHDFNNILMAVLGHAELALAEISPMSPVRGSIAEISTAARRAADLCRQMLAYAGKASFALERVALRDLSVGRRSTWC